MLGKSEFIALRTIDRAERKEQRNTQQFSALSTVGPGRSGRSPALPYAKRPRSKSILAPGERSFNGVCTLTAKFFNQSRMPAGKAAAGGPTAHLQEKARAQPGRPARLPAKPAAAASPDRGAFPR